VIIGNWIWNKILGLKNKHIGHLVKLYLIYSVKIKSKLQEKNEKKFILLKEYIHFILILLNGLL